MNRAGRPLFPCSKNFAFGRLALKGEANAGLLQHDTLMTCDSRPTLAEATVAFVFVYKSGNV
jgi:hypothetical protein